MTVSYERGQERTVGRFSQSKSESDPPIPLAPVLSFDAGGMMFWLCPASFSAIERLPAAGLSLRWHSSRTSWEMRSVSCFFSFLPMYFFLLAVPPSTNVGSKFSVTFLWLDSRGWIADSAATTGGGGEGVLLFSFPSLPCYCYPLLPAMLQVLFRKYTEFAKAIMSALPPEDVPADLSDSHLFVNVCDKRNAHQNETVLRNAATTVENGYESCTSMVEVRSGCFSQSHGREGTFCDARGPAAAL